MTLIHILILLTTTLLLTACGTTQQPPPTQVQSKSDIRKAYQKRFEQLYLRGTFSLWGYDEQYKLEQISKNTYAAAADLKRGLYYEFMFSAKDATQAYANCGYLHAKDQLLKPDKKVKARCTDVVLQNFSFSPEKSGVYEFFINFANIDSPRVYVQRAY